MIKKLNQKQIDAGTFTDVRSVHSDSAAQKHTPSPSPSLLPPPTPFSLSTLSPSLPTRFAESHHPTPSAPTDSQGSKYLHQQAAVFLVALNFLAMVLFFSQVWLVLELCTQPLAHSKFPRRMYTLLALTDVWRPSPLPLHFCGSWNAYQPAPSKSVHWGIPHGVKSVCGLAVAHEQNRYP
jgi:hypothetical protein